MSKRKDRRPEELVLDPGVLREGPVCEFGSDLGVEVHGGLIVTPWREAFRAAEAAELPVVSETAQQKEASFDQIVVHLQKSRAATFEDLAEAWRLLAPGGQLLFAGSNALGVVSAVKRLAKELDQTGIVVTNRARARVVRFKRDDGAGPQRDETSAPIEIELESIHKERHAIRLETAPGVFSAKKLDAGSELLLQALPRFIGHKPPKRVVDLGCGAGTLGLSAATLFPEAEVLLVDADARAVACTQANIERLALGDRCRVGWWDAREATLDSRFTLALINPPFHYRGAEVDLGPALALFDSLSGWLKPGGRALIVANRTLPYEAALAEYGAFESVDSTRGYKLLSLKRSARSSGAKGRNAPGSRSFGKSKPPTRSR